MINLYYVSFIYMFYYFFIDNYSYQLVSQNILFEQINSNTTIYSSVDKLCVFNYTSFYSNYNYLCSIYKKPFISNLNFTSNTIIPIKFQEGGLFANISLYQIIYFSALLYLINMLQNNSGISNLLNPSDIVVKKYDSGEEEEQHKKSKSKLKSNSNSNSNSNSTNSIYNQNITDINNFIGCNNIKSKDRVLKCRIWKTRKV